MSAGTAVRLSPDHLEELRRAKALLERPGLAARVTGLIGMPVEKAMDLLPARWSEAVAVATRESLGAALRLAVTTLDDRPQGRSFNLAHKVAVAATGAGGGAFGLAGLPIELPISTTVMLRSIADIARSEGEALGASDAQLACLEVFALGGRSSADDATESSYFVVRAALARAVSDAARYVAERGIAEETAPIIVRLLAQIASRFGLVVSQKVAAQAVPLVGAAAGSAINVLFMDHFQQLARGHFIVRRLERVYSAEAVQAAYEQLP
jgi:hypothetical protein